jgi:hypothetical protein
MKLVVREMVDEFPSKSILNNEEGKVVNMASENYDEISLSITSLPNIEIHSTT